MWWIMGIALAADPACPWGVNAHLASNDALDLAASAGIAWVRMDVNWFQVEPAPGQYEWTELDRFVDHAASLGLNVFMTLGYTPAWAAEPGCDDGSADETLRCLNHPPDPTLYAGFVTEVVQRYQDRVTHYGLWNEPNLLHFFDGSRDQYVNQVLVPGADAVHAACPSCQTLGPELANLRDSANWDVNAGTCVLGECIYNAWEESLSRILQDAGASIDIITHHKYTDPAPTWWEEAVEGQTLVVQYMHGIQWVTQTHAPGKPVWITEVGWETPPAGSHDPQYAADQLTLLVEGFAEAQAGTLPGTTQGPWTELEKLFWYDLHDDPSGIASWGLLDDALVPKPAWQAYADWIALTGCAAAPPSHDTGDTGLAVDTADTGTPDPGTPPTDPTTGSTTEATTPTGTTASDGEPEPSETDGKAPEGCGCVAPTTGTAGGLLTAALRAVARRG